MKRFNQPIQLIVDYQPDPTMKRTPDAELQAADVPISAIVSLATPQIEAKKGVSDESGELIVKSEVNDLEVHPWDLAHAVFNVSANFKFVEPDFCQEFPVDDKLKDSYDGVSAKSFGKASKGGNFDPDWPPFANEVWHLGDNFSQLKSAREQADAASDYVVRIGHLDTGYTDHPVIAKTIKDNPLQRNFIKGEDAEKSLDIGSEGILRQPFHGTGTLGILAGGKISLQTASGTFDDELGGAPFAEVVCCRISKSVVLFQSSAFAEALNYLTSLSLNHTQIHVVTMSMGGAPSRAWARAVNAAYEAGITVVTAAGNNFSGLPVRHLVYPARFQRVIAACGVTNDYSPYYTKLVDEMQGNFGPDNKMGKALGAFTPNIPWLKAGSNTADFDGAGTSSATPQIAAAAAIYYHVHHEALDALPEKWQKVEAVRNALYSSAKKKIKHGFSTYSKYFGNGIVQAADALKVAVTSDLKKTPADSCPWFPILNTLFKAAPLSPIEQARLEMFSTELWQMVYSYPELAAMIEDEGLDFEEIADEKWNAFKYQVLIHPGASNTLKAFLKDN